MTQTETRGTISPTTLSLAFLTDKELADILVLTVQWVRCHAQELPGFKRLGSYYRFCGQMVEEWLGSLETLLVAEQVAILAKLPESWIYANADQIPGLLRLGRYVRFRPVEIQKFLQVPELVQ